MKAEAPEEYCKIQYGRIKQSLKYKHEYQGQRYRNLLELNVAKILTEMGVEFKYEQFVQFQSKFFFPDFVIGRTVIECTFWFDVEQKARELKLKINCYTKSGSNLSL